MIQKVLVCALLLVASLAFAATAYLFFDMARIQHARPEALTRIVLSFEGLNDPSGFETARETLQARLEGAGASEIHTERRGANEILVEYRPLSTDETDDDAAQRLTRRGRLRFLVGVDSERVLGTSMTREQQKLDDWRTAHPDLPLARFHALAPEAGGPVEGLSWYPARQDLTSPSPDVALIPLVEPKPEWRFGTPDLASVSPSSDMMGSPAVDFGLKSDRVTAFGDFTESIVNKSMAIVIDGELITLATVHSRLEGRTMISGGRGGFTHREVRELITTLRAGELPIEPTLVSTDHVSATRGKGSLGWGVAAALALTVSLALLVLCARSLRRPTRGRSAPPPSDQTGWSSPRTTG